MISVLLLIATRAPQNPPAAPLTFEDVEIAKIRAFHDLPRFELEAEIKSPHQDTVFTVLKDGSRWDIAPKDLGKHYNNQFEIFDDGNNTLYILDDSHTLVSKGDAEGPLDPMTLLLKSGPSFAEGNYEVNRQPQFSIDPSFAIVSDESVRLDGHRRRKVVAKFPPHDGLLGETQITITQWFLPDKWIAMRTEVAGSTSRGPVDATWQVKKFDPNPKNTEKVFALVTSRIATYKKYDSTGRPLGQGLVR